MSEIGNEDLAEFKIRNRNSKIRNVKIIWQQFCIRQRQKLEILSSTFLYLKIEKLRDRKYRKSDLVESKIGPYGVS